LEEFKATGSFKDMEELRTAVSFTMDDSLALLFTDMKWKP
jgi:hypothetical protein